MRTAEARCRLTIEDRARGFHQGQSTSNAHKQAGYSDAVRPSSTDLLLRGSPYSPRYAALKEARRRSAAAQASVTNALLDCSLSLTDELSGWCNQEVLAHWHVGSDPTIINCAHYAKNVVWLVIPERLDFELVLNS